MSELASFAALATAVAAGITFMSQGFCEVVTFHRVPRIALVGISGGSDAVCNIERDIEGPPKPPASLVTPRRSRGAPR